MTGNIEKVKAYSEYYTTNFNIDPVKKDFPKVNTIEECLGKRNLYEPCLELTREEIESKGMDKVIEKILNIYPYGMSSGLFHTIIRVYYAVEGAKIDNKLINKRILSWINCGRKSGRKCRDHSPEFSVDTENKRCTKYPIIMVWKLQNI